MCSTPNYTNRLKEIIINIQNHISIWGPVYNKLHMLQWTKFRSRQDEPNLFQQLKKAS